MIQNENDNFIRKINSDFISCTITDVDDKGIAKIEYEKFKKALFDISCIIIYKYKNSYYYPLTMEYRLIDNNILYLIKELNIKNFEKIFKVLTSSMNKEEKWSNQFKLIIIHIKNKPKYCYKVNDLNVDNVNKKEIYE